MNDQDEVLYISPAKAARILGVSRWTVYELVKADRFPSKRLDGRILIEHTPLMDYVDSLPSAAESA